MTLLSVDGVSHTFMRNRQPIHAVDDVTFEIGAGETLALCGPSGSGKSTIARIVVNLLKPDRGTVRFMGLDWSTQSSETLRRNRRYLQMVFQDPNAAFNPRATVEAVIGDPLRVHGIIPQAEQDGEITRLMQRVGLDASLRYRRRHELSGGQRQRAAIARAIASRPNLIVLDEATSALDATRRSDILRLLIELQQELGVSYLMISHDIALVRAVAHRVAILDHGKVAETGDAMAVIDNPRSAIGRALVAATP